jgi:hypothetical protein
MTQKPTPPPERQEDSAPTAVDAIIPAYNEGTLWLPRSPRVLSRAARSTEFTLWMTARVSPTVIRAGRNLVKGRLSFLPVDIALWAYALWIATERALKHLSARH